MTAFTLSIQGQQPISGSLTLESCKRYLVRPDQETVRWGYKVRPVAPAPAVFRTGVKMDTESFRRARFNASWQYYAVDLLALSKYGRMFEVLLSAERAFIVKAFCSLYAGNRAFTNGKGVDSFTNYITNEIRAEEPMIDPLICAGSIVTGDEEGAVVKLLSFRASEPPPNPDLEDPRVLWATVIRTDGTLDNFPQLGGGRVPYPYIAVEPYYYPLQEMRLVVS